MDAQAILVDPLRILFARLASFVPVLLGALLILLIGWVVARILQEVLVRALKTVRVDDLAERAGLGAILRKGAVSYTFAELLGVFVYWLILLGALVAAVNTLGLTATAELLDRVLLYIPNVVAGVIILTLGGFFAAMLGSLVQTVAANAGVKQSRGLGSVTKVVLMVFAIEVALEKFIGMTTLHMQLNILIAAVAAGAALAFGLGCKDLAGRFASDIVDKWRRG
ncbi:MAG: hypothetical protein HY600_03115 [Candidatus Omnitrophica bacterium]|nr:hypothetical protein [Candidatus Omnitrophota bacterium]